jgi:protein-disulfide isomerase
MEENNIEKQSNNSQKQIAGAIIIAGLVIAGAILLKDSRGPQVVNGVPVVAQNQIKMLPDDRTFGDPKAKLTIVLYEDFQCPFCGKFFQESEEPIRNTYVKSGDVKIIYRDFAFLGSESMRSAEAARCALDQNKFWEYHDYLFTHQNGENRGNFSDPNLKSFASKLGLDRPTFDKCLDDGKYVQAVIDSTNEGKQFGVQGTPKGFILKNGKTVATIDGAEPLVAVKQKIDSALK